MLYNDDCTRKLKELNSESVDLVFADPPYFLSNNGLSIKSGKVVSVNKGEWDKKVNYDDIKAFTNNWIKECFRILKTGGTIWISGTTHNIFDIRDNLIKEGFKIVNIIIWHKIDPPPLIYKNKFRFSYEFIIFACKGRNKTFNYEYLFNIENKEMDDVWNISAVKMSEKTFGYHPTQKPEELLQRIILSSTKTGDTVLDPFMGSGTTCVVSKRLGRNYIGIEKEEKYFSIAKNRIKNTNTLYNY